MVLRLLAAYVAGHNIVVLKERACKVQVDPEPCQDLRTTHRDEAHGYRTPVEVYQGGFLLTDVQASRVGASSSGLPSKIIENDHHRQNKHTPQSVYSVRSRSSCTSVLWQLHELQRSDDPERFTVDKHLQSVFTESQTIKLSELSQLLNAHLVPAEPVRIDYSFSPRAAVREIYDIEVEFGEEDGEDSIYDISPDDQTMLVELDEKIEVLCREISEARNKREFMQTFARDPKVNRKNRGALRDPRPLFCLCFCFLLSMINFPLTHTHMPAHTHKYSHTALV